MTHRDQNDDTGSQIAGLEAKIALLEAELRSYREPPSPTQRTATERRYQRLVRYLTDYIYTVVIRDGNVVATYHGPGCFVVTGYSSEEYANDPELWYRMVYEEDRHKVTDYSNRALSGEQVNPFEHRIIHKDRSTRWVRNSIVLNMDDQGRVVSYDGLIRDITQEKKAEELAEVQKQQLIQADKMASLGVLVAGVAHEINNPNNFIMLNSRLLERVVEDARPILDEYLQEHGDFELAGMSYAEERQNINRLFAGMVEGSKRIQGIIRNLKRLARQNREDLNQRVKLDQVIQTAVFFVNHRIQRSTKRFSLMVQPNLPAVRGNDHQLEQVLMNLLINACQAISDKEQRISLTTTLDCAKNCVILTVEDTGMGIPESNLRRIFDPFFTTKRDLEGTGLGLSISYQIIKNHGGDLTVESKTGSGTRFIITLPVYIEETDE